ncbi:MAG: carboxypeptidase-like regulatory domain-containing protein [Bacteroidia bacterium]
MFVKNSSLLLLFLLFSFHFSYSQKTATVYGTITGINGVALFGVNISEVGETKGAVTDEKGKFSLIVPAEKEITIAFSHVGYTVEKITLTLSENQQYEFNKKLTSLSQQIPEVEITDQKERQTNLIRIDPKSISQIPTVSGNFEDVLKTLPGVISNNELSSQYSVRGGNYDENLVYVNDIEIYRPFLVRSGQQEGLSFINGDMVSSILFSAGGFEAIYGDKLSSVLDIKYRKPVKFAGSANMSLLGGGLSLEGITKNKKFTWLTGIRYKSNQYLLKSLDTKGEYKPTFADGQAYLTYQVTKKTELAFLGNYSKSKYRFVPTNRETDFGTINQALRLTVYFDGQEIDDFETMTGALSLTHYVSEKLKLKFTTSLFTTQESERFDILGQYYLDELERDLGSDEFGDVAFNRGIGSYLDHARNELNGFVYNAEHKGNYYYKNSELQWGIKYQHEEFTDKLNEWNYVDSAGFSLPHPRDSVGQAGPYNQEIILQNVLKAKNNVVSNRFNGYLQDSWQLGVEKRTSLTVGIRATYCDLNEDLVGGPRVSFSYKPKWKRNLVFRAASGFYYQPPFYRELRDLDGKINPNLKAQSSIHFIAGSDYQFLAWGREFKFVSEIYYKILDDLVPYKIENLRIRYFADNNSKGYAAGADFRINGEFVQGTESWVSMSILQTREDIIDDYYYDYYNSDGEKIIKGYTLNSTPFDSIRIEPGYIPRPTDQRFTFSMFFQDYLPKFPSYKMHLSLIFGTGLPFGPPGRDRYKDILRVPNYRRVDIGFSKTFIDEDQPKKHRLKFANHINSLWISLEVFNLLQVSNTVSYLWIADVTNRYYAVPNYLSARTINLRLNVKF